jgi:dienelactone hydrolase
MVHTFLPNTLRNRAALLWLIAPLLVLVGCPPGVQVTGDAKPTLECGRLAQPDATNTRCELPKTTGVEEQIIEFPSNATSGGLITLRGVLTTPKWGAGANPPMRLPGVLLLPGSGPQFRDEVLPADLKGPFAAPVPILKDVANALAARGFVVLRYDKRTCTSRAHPNCQYPPEIATRAGWDDLLGDAEAATAFLRSQPQVDTSDLILAGHSQGATIALIIGQKVKPGAYVLMSGLYDPVDKALVRQTRWQLDANSKGLTAKQRAVAENQIAEIESGMLAIREGYWPDDAMLLGLPGNFWKRWIDDGETAQRLLRAGSTPVLYLRGDDDENASTVDEAGYREALAKRTGSAVVSLPGLSHGLHDRTGPGKVSPAASDAVIDWLLR